MSAYSFEYNCMVATFYVGEVIMYDANFFVSNFFLSNTMLLLHLLSRPLAMTQVNSSHTKN